MEYSFFSSKSALATNTEKMTTKSTLRELNTELQKDVNQIRILGILKKNIPDRLLKEHYAQCNYYQENPREVILSEYLD